MAVWAASTSSSSRARTLCQCRQDREGIGSSPPVVEVKRQPSCTLIVGAYTPGSCRRVSRASLAPFLVITVVGIHAGFLPAVLFGGAGQLQPQFVLRPLGIVVKQALHPLVDILPQDHVTL